MFRKNQLQVLGVVAVALLLGLVMGCEPAEEDADRAEQPLAVTDVTQVSVSAVGNQLIFDTEEIRVPVGSNVRVVLINPADQPAMIHNWVLTSAGQADRIGIEGAAAGEENEYVPDDPDVLAYTPLAGPGDVVEVTFEAPPAGTYDFVCTFPGHFATMQGRFIVE